MRVEYHPAVQDELLEIRDYYNGESVGLGADFVDEFERQIAMVAAMPTRWMVVRNDIRRALLKRFPYVIHFRILSDGAIRVTVVKHSRRHPSLGLGRE